MIFFVFYRIVFLLVDRAKGSAASACCADCVFLCLCTHMRLWSIVAIVGFNMRVTTKDYYFALDLGLNPHTKRETSTR